MDEPITKIISNQLDIKLGQFTQEELDLVLRKLTYCFNTATLYITRAQETDGQRDASSLSPRRVTSE